MASFTTVSSKGLGDVFTETMWDQAIRDNLNGLLTPPLAVVRRTSSVSLTAGVETPVELTTEDYDTDGMHSTVSSPSRLTCVTPGIYLVAAWGSFTATSTANHTFRLSILRNGSTPIAGQMAHCAEGYTTVLNIAGLAFLAAGDYVDLYAWAVETGYSLEDAQMQACWVGRGD